MKSIARWRFTGSTSYEKRARYIAPSCFVLASPEADSSIEWRSCALLDPGASPLGQVRLRQAPGSLSSALGQTWKRPTALSWSDFPPAADEGPFLRQLETPNSLGV